MYNNEYEEMLAWRNKAMKSFNYNYIYMFINTLFFKHTLFENCVDKISTSKVLAICAKMTADNMHLDLDERFLNLKHHFATGEDGSSSIVIEFEGPWDLETECNYIALVKNPNGTKIMYTSEYYADSKTFKLCKTDESGNRVSYSYVTNTLGEFLKAIKHKKN